MTTGTLPFMGETHGAILGAILHLTPTPSLQLNPHCPPKLGDVISKALEKDPNQRYQSAAEMRTELQSLLQARQSEIAARRSWRTLTAMEREAEETYRSCASIPATVSLTTMFEGVAWSHGITGSILPTLGLSFAGM